MDGCLFCLKLTEHVLELGFEADHSGGEGIVASTICSGIIAHRNAEKCCDDLLFAGGSCFLIGKHTKNRSRHITHELIAAIAHELIAASGAPSIERLKERMKRDIRFSCLGRQAFLLLTKEVTTMLDNVMNSQVDEADISLPIGFHQPFA